MWKTVLSGPIFIMHKVERFSYVSICTFFFFGQFISLPIFSKELWSFSLNFSYPTCPGFSLNSFLLFFFVWRSFHDQLEGIVAHTSFSNPQSSLPLLM